MLTKDTLFRPTKTETKLSNTTSIAKGIVEAQTAMRQATMAKLREARIARDASQAALNATMVQKKPRKKTSATALTAT